ncbi:unnamed protein product, partial [Prorocentrum cordatum]
AARFLSPGASRARHKDPSPSRPELMAPAASRRSRLLGCALALLAVGAPLRAALLPAFVPAPARAGAPTAAAAAAAVAGVLPEAALAKGGVWGPLEGKASSLVHPFVMAILFLTTAYTGYLGWQWRQLRTVGADLTVLKKQYKEAEGPDGEVSSAAAAMMKDRDRRADRHAEGARRRQVQGPFEDRHHQISSLLLGGGIFFTAYGTFNTFFRAEKLFPGPHLYAGVGICVIWALAAACVPWMEKGNETARTAHIGLNVICFLLFTWQLFTGFEIFLKVLGAPIPWF